ncbi:MAG: ATP-dependent DNA helicase RecQ [Nocardioidaceae bacterium]|nr:ATP-dependent DNA helicase RecQ [Nocardioidaceae bacterium]
MSDREAQLTAEQAAIAGQVIEALAGTGARLRADQAIAVAALAQPAARVLVVQATGWGKSAVYWAATAVKRAAGDGPTLVVSPLLSLMRDQIAAAGRAGLRAATLNSSNLADWSGIEQALLQNGIDVLLVSPERLANPGFGRRVLDTLAGRLGLVVVDEAHAVSDWGHDFRPDYRRMTDVLQRLNPATAVLATTATANARVTTDVAQQLGDSTLVLRGPLARSSLELSVTDTMSPLERYAWVVEHLPALAGSGIIYTLTVADADRLAGVIQSVHGAACPVAAYTGGLEGDERIRLEDALRDNSVRALVATSALGMGYDKPDLGFVVHLGSPPSPVSYYQQVGRAGRGIDLAQVVLLPSAADEGVWDYFATATIPDPDHVHRLLAGLDASAAAAAGARPGAASVTALEAETGLRRGRVELLLKQLAVEGVVERVEAGWVRLPVEWEFDAAHYDSIIATRRREADIMRRYTRSESCLMQLLQESLDDDTAAPCGRCSVCRRILSAPLSARPKGEVVAEVSRLLRGDTHELAPRKMWPGGEFGTRGRIPAQLMAETGRILIFADAPEWRETVAALSAGDTEALPVVCEASVEALKSWRTSWARRPEVVVSLAVSGDVTGIAGAVADHLANVGSLPRAAVSVTEVPADIRELNSGQEAAWWREHLVLDPLCMQQLGGSAVLLVVDASSTSWPITVAAAKLREAGAELVLPLLVHQRL